MNEFRIEKFGERTVCIGGIGKMFYQEGFPISMAVSDFKEKGIEVSIFHVADECLKNGWSSKTTYTKLKADFEDGGFSNDINWDNLKQFCYASYEEQREMIFQYLFGLSSDARDSEKFDAVLNFFREKITN